MNKVAIVACSNGQEKEYESQNNELVEILSPFSELCSHSHPMNKYELHEYHKQHTQQMKGSVLSKMLPIFV